MKRSIAICGAALLVLASAQSAQAQSGKDQPATGQAGTRDQQREAARLQNEARALMQAGNYAAALPLFARCYSLHREVFGDQSNITLVSLTDYATALEGLGRFDEAEPLFAEVMRGFREQYGERDINTLASTSNYARVLEALGRTAEAAPLYAGALQTVRELLGNRDPNTIAAITNYAGVLEDLGRSTEAEPLYAEALQLAREVLGDNDRLTIKILANYAISVEALGRLAEAEPLSADALRMRRGVLGDRHPDTLASMNNHAALLNSLGRTREAADLAEAALRLRREVLGERHPATLNSMANYAVILRGTGRPEDALPLYAEAYRLQSEVLGEAHPDTLQSLDNYAATLSSLGRYGEALPLYETAVQMRREQFGDRHPATLRTLNNYALLLGRIGWVDEAFPILAEVLQTSREVLGDRHPETLTSMTNYAIALNNSGRVDEAVALVVEAATASREMLGDRHPDTLSMIANQVLALHETGLASEALPLGRELAAGYRSRAMELGSAGLSGQAQAEREFGNRQFAEKVLVDVLYSYLEDSGFSESGLAIDAFEGLQRASAGSTSRAVAEAAAARFASGMGLQQLVQERQSLLQEWTAIEAALVESQAGGEEVAANRRDLRERLTALDPRIAGIDARLAAEAPQYAAILEQQAVSVDDLREVLDADEAVLFLIPARSGTHVMALTRDGLQWVRAPLHEGDIEQAVSNLRTGMEVVPGANTLPLFDLELAHALYTNLIAPIEDTLAGRNRVYVVADGPLSRIPLGTLVASPPPPGADADDPEVLRSTDWLADRYALVQLPSVQSLVYIRRFGQGETSEIATDYVGFGAPALGGAASTRGGRSGTLLPVDAATMVESLRGANGKPLMNPAALYELASLPGTQTELERVRAALGDTDAPLFLAMQMTETTIRTADLSDTRIVHLATHGFTSEEAGSLAEPGLVFTPPAIPGDDDDGYLAASEVVGIDLTSAEWVILSACNTASPSGRPGATGLSGLAQAFFYAGAQSLLVSHWPVFDDVAPALTVEMLRRWQAGTPRAEALQAAMREVRNDPALDASHPAVWAPFTLAGEGR